MFFILDNNPLSKVINHAGQEAKQNRGQKAEKWVTMRNEDERGREQGRGTATNYPPQALR